jgi:hypothetical protein
MRAVREGRAGVAEHEAAVATSGSPEGGLSPVRRAAYDDAIESEPERVAYPRKGSPTGTRRGLSPGETARESEASP